MTVFENKGTENSAAALQMAVSEAKKLGAPLLVATTTGVTAVQAVEMAKENGIINQLIIVSHAYGTRVKGENNMKPENRRALDESGVKIITAAHVLSGAERAMSTKFSGVYPVEIIAHTLRMLSQGVKVAVEMGAMAVDCGAVEYGKPVVAVGGTGRGADTVTVLTPEYTQDIFGTKIHEIICKPY